MGLIWGTLTTQEKAEVLELVQKQEALKLMLAKIEGERKQAEGLWRNRMVALQSELTAIVTRLGEIRKPTKE